MLIPPCRLEEAARACSHLPQSVFWKVSATIGARELKRFTCGAYPRSRRWLRRQTSRPRPQTARTGWLPNILVTQICGEARRPHAQRHESITAGPALLLGREFRMSHRRVGRVITQRSTRGRSTFSCRLPERTFGTGCSSTTNSF